MNWYNKYRPADFNEVLGQELVKSVLENSLTQGRIKHGYLFNGPKGVGKTTIARIFASKLNQLQTQPENSIDIIELDAASNTGIDNIRQLIDSSKTPPISAKWKIYIIDEVHMLSKNAMNALLKTLEEPPEYLVFLLATTNPEKLLPTVLSRLTKLNLTGHTQLDLTKNLRRIADLENINIDDPSLDLIAKRSTGSQRDAINLLETIASYDLENISINNASQILGLLPIAILDKTIAALEYNKLSSELILEIENLGFDGDTFLGQLLEYLIDTGFNNSNNFSILIPVIAETISLKLPLSSPLTSLAIIQAKILNVTKKLPQEELNYQKKTKLEVIEPINLAIENILENSESSKNIVPNNIDSIPDNIPVTNEMPAPFIKLDGVVSLPLLTHIVENSSKEKQAPPILKMLIKNLEITEFNKDEITLATNNSIFLTQLNNPKILNFFKDLLIQKTGNTYHIKVIIKNSASQPKISNYNPTPIEPEIKPAATIKPVELKPKDTPNSTKKPFYSVYKNLPENIDSFLIEVFTGNLEPPQKLENWDEQASSMFEFE
jgi:DNA polymerase III subunit gamma/tau